MTKQQDSELDWKKMNLSQKSYFIVDHDCDRDNRAGEIIALVKTYELQAERRVVEKLRAWAKGRNRNTDLVPISDLLMFLKKLELTPERTEEGEE